MASVHLELGVRAMRVLGVGLDLVDVARVERMLERHGHRVLERLLSEQERDYCQSLAFPARHVAARIAAKEAAYKALSQAGTEEVLWWGDMEVLRDSRGRPHLRLLERAKGCADAVGVVQCLLSLTHSEEQAGAIVIILGRPRE